MITKKGTFYYSIPQKYKKLLNFNFCKSMLGELHKIYGLSLEDYAWDDLDEGTGGWYEAFASTCRKCGVHELLTYYRHLAWYDSDLFDEELSNLFVSYKLILPETKTKEVARQNNLNEENVWYCFKADKCFKTDIKCKNFANDDFINSCNECEIIDELEYLDADNILAIKEVLGLEEKDYFICKTCGKIHSISNQNYKNKDICEHCAIVQKQIDEKMENVTPIANYYYKEECSRNEKYVDQIKKEFGE